MGLTMDKLLAGIDDEQQRAQLEAELLAFEELYADGDSKEEGHE